MKLAASAGRMREAREQSSVGSVPGVLRRQPGRGAGQGQAGGKGAREEGNGECSILLPHGTSVFSRQFMRVGLLRAFPVGPGTPEGYHLLE